MRVQRLWLVGAMLFMPAGAQAHDHIADAFLGFCDAKASNLPGFQVSVGWTIPKLPTKKLSVLGDVNFNGGSHEDVDVKRFTFLGGLRYTLAGDKTKLVPSVHVLTGAVHDNGGPQEGNEPALAIGAAFDYVPQAVSGWGARFQVDYVINGGDNFPKFSIGAVYRFHH